MEVLCQRADGAKLQIAAKDRSNRRSLGFDHNDLLIYGRVAERHRATDPNAFALRGGDLSRTRSPISSRSNWAKDSSTLSVSRPMLELVLNDCVTDTNDTLC